MVLRLDALFIIHILPENTGPRCNYKLIGGGMGGGGGGSGGGAEDMRVTYKQSPPSGDAPACMSHTCHSYVPVCHPYVTRVTEL